jgi:hypothetical protein
MKIIRVFPRKTEATPNDKYVVAPPTTKSNPQTIFKTCVPDMFVPECDEIHISVTYTYDMWIAEKLAKAWEAVGVPVKMGGPALGKKAGEFTPGLYLKPEYTVSSRGCPNNCWFCRVPKIEGKLREYPIKAGWNIIDDNLLACSDEHINAVFDMLKTQSEKPIFSGGLEAKILKPWHCKCMKQLGTRRMYFAYDTPDDLEPLFEAGKMLREAGISEASHTAGCYILIGYKGDTYDKALHRIHQTIDAGFMPYAMLYRSEKGIEKPDWRGFQRQWCGSMITAANVAKYKANR